MAQWSDSSGINPWVGPGYKSQWCIHVSHQYKASLRNLARHCLNIKFLKVRDIIHWYSICLACIRPWAQSSVLENNDERLWSFSDQRGRWEARETLLPNQPGKCSTWEGDSCWTHSHCLLADVALSLQIRHEKAQYWSLAPSLAGWCWGMRFWNHCSIFRVVTASVNPDRCNHEKVHQRHTRAVRLDWEGPCLSEKDGTHPFGGESACVHMHRLMSRCSFCY